MKHRKHIPTKKRIRIKLHSEKTGSFTIYPTIKELFDLADVVFPDEKLVATMETGYLYDWGVANNYPDPDCCSFLVKLYMDPDTPPTSKIEPDYEYAVCFVIPSNLIMYWTQTKGE